MERSARPRREVLEMLGFEDRLDQMSAAVSVSAAVGVFCGFYPEWKASRLDRSRRCAG